MILLGAHYYPALASFLLGVFGASLINIASFVGYRKRVLKEAKEADLSIEDEDEDILQSEDDIKDFIKSEKSKRKFLPAPQSLITAVLPLRISAYVLFALGFLVLNRHELLDPIALCIGIAVSVLGCVVVAKKLFKFKG